MKRSFWLAALLVVATGRPTMAQQNELAALRAELARQQATIAQLLQRIDALEKKQSAPPSASRQDLQEDIKAQQDEVNSLREIVTGKVNLNGYYNFRFSADGSEIPNAFQQHHLGVLMAKQLGRFGFLMELELQNVPHHPEIVPVEDGEGEGHAEGEGAEHTEITTDISGEGQVAVENAWMEYNHNRFFTLRVGKQLSPQYWWQNHYPNLTYSTALPIYLRELFPAELVGVMVQGTAARPAGTSEFGLNYKVYVANNNFEGNSRTDLRDGKSWGGRLQARFPTGGAIRRFDVAADLYRGHVGLTNQELAEDNVFGFEGQIEIVRFLLNTEYARGESLGQTRSGYYLQPAIRLSEDWLTFYRAEQLLSPRVQRAERRHIAGINYRPHPQIALKAEYYRSVPLNRDFIHSDEARKPFNGLATAAVFFF
jgi:hypothetical protein